MPNYELYNYIKSSYRGVGAFADGTKDELLKNIHIKTKLDVAIVNAVTSGKDVVLTGNPGDGKTHLLRVLSKKIKKANPKTIIELDASEKPNNKIITNWKRAAKAGTPYCIAINEAVLLALSETKPVFERAVGAQKQVEEAIQYSADGANIANSSDTTTVVFDLSRRNVLSQEMVRAVINKFGGAELPPACENIYTIKTHAVLIQSTIFQTNLQELFDRLNRRKFHCTIRELQGFVGYLLGKGLEPEKLAETQSNDCDFITELVYSGDGALFDAIRGGFDPASICHPIWDNRIVSNDIKSSTWCADETELYHAAEVDDAEDIERRRRRFYFFNSQGHELRTIESDIDAQFKGFLAKKPREVLRELIPKINRAFCYKKSNEELRIWKHHHYDNSTQQVLYSTAAVRRKDLEVLHPRLACSMEKGFDYLPDHLIMQAKNKPNKRLHVDFEMYSFLVSTDFGTRVIGSPSYMARRLWQFMERLSSLGNIAESEIDAKLLDVQTGRIMDVTVDMDERRYISIKDDA
jgi:hypothetical protein